MIVTNANFEPVASYLQYSKCTARDIIMAQFIYEEISEWNVNKSANRLDIYAPKVEYYTTFSSYLAFLV
jgi:hypothetical protein